VSYGIGFTPASREGWALVIAHIILVFVWATIFLRNHMDDEMRFIAFITIFFAQTGLLLWIAHRKGEEQ
jgi:nicotinamide riboside transporter PnuC